MLGPVILTPVCLIPVLQSLNLINISRLITAKKVSHYLENISVIVFINYLFLRIHFFHKMIYIIRLFTWLLQSTNDYSNQMKTTVGKKREKDQQYSKKTISKSLTKELYPLYIYIYIYIYINYIKEET